jgi:hypothetical protein
MRGADMARRMARPSRKSNSQRLVGEERGAFMGPNPGVDHEGSIAIHSIFLDVGW